MPLSISIRFLTGRAHLHPWQTHHSEGRVEWPPSQWRLLRALVAVAGRGLTTLPAPDLVFQTSPPSTPKKRGNKAQSSVSPVIDLWKDQPEDELSLSRLATLLATLSRTPTIWLAKTAGGHTRQYFPIHAGGTVKNSGSAVFDTFATVRKDQPLVFHWPDAHLDSQPLADLKLILGRMTYFGRAESWCCTDAHGVDMKELPDMVTEGAGQTHWRCVCIEAAEPDGKEYRDYTLERRLAPCKDMQAEVSVLLPRTKPIAAESRPSEDDFREFLKAEPAELSLLRCLLRESGQDIKDGLERPIGTRWVHYAVPRAIYDVPRPIPARYDRPQEAVDLVVYALNTATVHRPVLPALTDTLLVADRFRSAAMALCRTPSRSLSGHEANDEVCKDHNHAFWWPMDEDNDGFIDHVVVYARGGFQPNEVDSLRRLSRLRQRGGRPDLLVSPTYVGREAEYRSWQGDRTTTFVSATPYHCPLSLSHGRTGGSRLRPITRVIREGLRRQGIVEDIEEISEIVFDYAPEELITALDAVEVGALQEPIHPRQYFAVVAPPSVYPPFPRFGETARDRFRGACLKDPDTGYPFGLSVGLRVDCGNRFVRALSFCRRRRQFQVKGSGRMFLIRFRDHRFPKPFAIGDQCHFGLGLFIPVPEYAQAREKAER